MLPQDLFRIFIKNL